LAPIHLGEFDRAPPVGLAEAESLETLPPEKNESGKETVKFRMLYQALTKVRPRGGKENGLGW